MSTVRATCPTCVSPVDLEPTQVLLLARSGVRGCGTYLFLCASCAQVAAKPADPADITLLTGAGVVAAPSAGQPGPVTVSWRVGAQAHPLTYDDLLDFHLLLDTDGWLAGLLAATDGPSA